MSTPITPLRTPPAAPGVDPAQAARAAFSIADAEVRAQAAGLDELPMEVTFEIAERCGFAATKLALLVRAEMHIEKANELQAFVAIRTEMGVK